MAFMTINGVDVPMPAYDSGGFSLSTLVDGGRNLEGAFIGTVIGDDKLKIETTFPLLSPEETARFLAMFDRRQGGSFTNTFRVYDPALGYVRDALMYVGDRSGRPFKISGFTGKPEYYRDIKANFIEV